MMSASKEISAQVAYDQVYFEAGTSLDGALDAAPECASLYRRGHHLEHTVPCNVFVRSIGIASEDLGSRPASIHNRGAGRSGLFEDGPATGQESIQ
jgi:hypothetical protein